jgi:hypothetical protein
MSRLMSVALTEAAVRARTKTVTRRVGWLFLKPGTRLTLVRKADEPLVRICDVQVVSVRRESLAAITPDEVALEGFPGMTPGEFVQRFFVDAQGLAPDTMVTRIEWIYLEEATRDA